uniref:Uncharacterized protein n=1 Tax=Steinernema glaseri TaxID=37863 RepID=A0A1I7Z8E3_9BILA
MGDAETRQSSLFLPTGSTFPRPSPSLIRLFLFIPSARLLPRHIRVHCWRHRFHLFIERPYFQDVILTERAVSRTDTLRPASLLHLFSLHFGSN